MPIFDKKLAKGRSVIFFLGQMLFLDDRWTEVRCDLSAAAFDVVDLRLRYEYLLHGVFVPNLVLAHLLHERKGYLTADFANESGAFFFGKIFFHCHWRLMKEFCFLRSPRKKFLFSGFQKMPF